MTSKLTVADIATRFSFEVLTDVRHLERPITVADLNRPGIELAGYTNYYAENRVQILGRTEISFLQTLDRTVLAERIAFLCKKTTPCLLITRQLDFPPIIHTLCEQRGVALLRTKLSTTNVSSRLTNYLENRLAPTTTVHGVLVDLYGVGVLITGTSGIGKSETALELVKRGHRLVADDAVEIRQTAENELHGNAPELIRHLLEIRGLGIINAMTLFGAGAVRNIKKISAVCHLEMWQQEKQYDRLGLDEEKTRIIDTDLPLMTIPVRPGRNLAVIIEVAAMNFRLKRMGYHAAEQFSTRLTETLEASKHVILDRLQEDFDETDP